MLNVFIHVISMFHKYVDSKMVSLMSFAKEHFMFFVYSSNLPELALLFLVCALIMIAVLGRHFGYQTRYELNLPQFLTYTAYFFFAVAVYWLILGVFFKYFAPYENFFMFYKTLRINLYILRIKTVIALIVACTLLTARRYLLLNKLTQYEYPLLVSLATFGMFLSVEANNWAILFLTLELQALCLLVLFSWNRKNLEAADAALKFSIVNFVASVLILLAIVLIVVHTQKLTIYYANPYFLMKHFNFDVLFAQDKVFQDWFMLQNRKALDFGTVEGLKAAYAQYPVYMHSLVSVLSLFDFYFGSAPMVKANYFCLAALYLLKTYDNVKAVLFYDFVSFLFIIGFTIKLGLAPFGMWLQDLYKGVSLPVLNFFATAPKFVYLTILVSLYVNLFAFFNGAHFLNMVLILAVVCIIVGNAALFSIKNQLLHLLAWSSVANMGLLFLLLSRFPYKSYSIMFMIYYTVASLLFFLVLQYVTIRINSTSTKVEHRNVLYFEDLAILRTMRGNDRKLFLIALFSLLSFFGIPPFIGFWMKFTVYYGIVKPMFMPYEVLTLSKSLLTEGYSISFVSWVFILLILYITLVGSYSYLQVFYTIVAGEHKEVTKQDLAMLPDSKKDTDFVVYLFVALQILFTIDYVNLTDMFDVHSLVLSDVTYPRRF